MGQGGQLVIVNGTPHTWRKTEESNRKMESWDLPDVIPPGTVGQTYVEFNQWSSTSGHTLYQVEGTEGVIRIEVSDRPNRIKARLANISVPDVADGSEIQLGWKHDGVTYFILSGTPGSYSTIHPPRDWMQRSLDTLGNRPLHKLCMPGSHDAGMSTVTWADNIPDSIIGPFTLTQSHSIRSQLDLGSRYFDIRPVISSGQHWTGHYAGGGSKLGARGEKISSIIDAVNEFTANNAELVILNLSHAMQSDDNFRDYNEGDWRSLMQELLRLEHRFVATEAEADDVSLLPLSRFIGERRAAVLCVVEANINLGDFRHQGFYLGSQLNIRNEYSNKDNLEQMVNDQLAKMQDHARSGDKRMFLISWTLTQQPPKDVGSLVGIKSIRSLAYEANKALVTRLFPAVNVDAFPNVVYLDFIDDSVYAALAIAINDKVFNT